MANNETAWLTNHRQLRTRPSGERAGLLMHFWRHATSREPRVAYEFEETGDQSRTSLRPPATLFSISCRPPAHAAQAHSHQQLTPSGCETAQVSMLQDACEPSSAFLLSRPPFCSQIEESKLSPPYFPFSMGGGGGSIEKGATAVARLRMFYLLTKRTIK